MREIAMTRARGTPAGTTAPSGSESASSAGRLVLTALGSFSLHFEGRDGGIEPLHLSPRLRDLLVCLLLSRGASFSRSQLAEVLWTDSGDGVNVGTVNAALSRLRHALHAQPLGLDDLVVRDASGRIRLHPDDPRVCSDVETFSTLVGPAMAKAPDGLSDADLDQLERGVAVWRGELLPGFQGAWALRHRELQRRLVLQVLARLMHARARRGELAGAIVHAQAMLALEPLREDIHRELMRLFLLAGQRAMALRQFEACRMALKRELAIQPMPATLELYQRIADSAVGHAHGQRPEAAAHIDEADAPAAGAAALPPTEELIEAARRHIAAADSQLRLALPPGRRS